MKARTVLLALLCIVTLGCEEDGNQHLSTGKDSSQYFIDDRDSNPNPDWLSKPISLTITKGLGSDSARYFFYYTAGVLDSIIHYATKSLLIVGIGNDTLLDYDSLHAARQYQPLKIIYTDFKQTTRWDIGDRFWLDPWDNAIPWDASLRPTKTHIYDQTKSGGWRILAFIQDSSAGDRIVSESTIVYDSLGTKQSYRREWQEYNSRGLIVAKLSEIDRKESGEKYFYELDGAGNPLRRSSIVYFADGDKQLDRNDKIYNYDHNKKLVGWSTYSSYEEDPGSPIYHTTFTGPTDSIAYFSRSSVDDYLLASIGTQYPLKYSFNYSGEARWGSSPREQRVSITLDNRRRIVQLSINDSFVQRISYFDDNFIRERTGTLSFVPYGPSCYIRQIHPMRTKRYYDKKGRVMRDEIFEDQEKPSSIRTYRY